MCRRNCGAIWFGISINIGKCIIHDSARRDSVYSAHLADVSRLTSLETFQRDFCVLSNRIAFFSHQGNQTL